MITVKFFGAMENMKGDLALFELDPLIIKPVNAISYLAKRNKLKSFSCPAVQSFLKNVFYICSPIDFSIVRDEQGRFSIINSREPDRDLGSFLFVKYPEPELLDNVPMLTIHLQYIFVNEKDNLEMQVLDAPLINLPLINMPGEFNVSKWIRPTNFCFFLDPYVKQLDIKRGDPLYAVKFKTDQTVTLEEIIDHSEKTKILTEQTKAVSLKKYYPYAKLADIYEIFQTRMKAIWK
jgi:hypothetical protein